MGVTHIGVTRIELVGTSPRPMVKGVKG